MTIEQAIGTYVLFSMDKADKPVFSLTPELIESRKVMERYLTNEQITKLAVVALDMGSMQVAKIIQFRNNNDYDGDEPA